MPRRTNLQELDRNSSSLRRRQRYGRITDGTVDIESHRNEFKTPRTSNRNKKKDKVPSSRNQVREQEESNAVQPKKKPDDEGILEEKDRNMVEKPMECRKRVESTRDEQLGTNIQVDNKINKKPTGEEDSMDCSSDLDSLGVKTKDSTKSSLLMNDESAFKEFAIASKLQSAVKSEIEGGLSRESLNLRHHKNQKREHPLGHVVVDKNLSEGNSSVNSTITMQTLIELGLNDEKDPQARYIDIDEQRKFHLSLLPDRNLPEVTVSAAKSSEDCTITMQTLMELGIHDAKYPQSQNEYIDEKKKFHSTLLPEKTFRKAHEITGSAATLSAREKCDDILAGKPRALLIMDDNSEGVTFSDNGKSASSFLKNNNSPQLCDKRELKRLPSDKKSGQHRKENTIKLRHPPQDTERQIFFEYNGTLIPHAPLPSGWEIHVSKTKNRPFYRHPDYGTSWHCPILNPFGRTRTASLSPACSSLTDSITEKDSDHDIKFQSKPSPRKEHHNGGFDRTEKDFRKAIPCAVTEISEDCKYGASPDFTLDVRSHLVDIAAHVENDMQRVVTAEHSDLNDSQDKYDKDIDADDEMSAEANGSSVSSLSTNATNSDCNTESDLESLLDQSEVVDASDMNNNESSKPSSIDEEIAILAQRNQCNKRGILALFPSDRILSPSELCSKQNIHSRGAKNRDGDFNVITNKNDCLVADSTEANSPSTAKNKVLLTRGQKQSSLVDEHNEEIKREIATLSASDKVANYSELSTKSKMHCKEKKRSATTDNTQKTDFPERKGLNFGSHTLPNDEQRYSSIYNDSDKDSKFFVHSRGLAKTVSQCKEMHNTPVLEAGEITERDNDCEYLKNEKARLHAAEEDHFQDSERLESDSALHTMASKKRRRCNDFPVTAKTTTYEGMRSYGQNVDDVYTDIKEHNLDMTTSPLIGKSDGKGKIVYNESMGQLGPTNISREAGSILHPAKGVATDERREKETESALTRIDKDFNPNGSSEYCVDANDDVSSFAVSDHSYTNDLTEANKSFHSVRSGESQDKLENKARDRKQTVEDDISATETESTDDRVEVYKRKGEHERHNISKLAKCKQNHIEQLDAPYHVDMETIDTISTLGGDKPSYTGDTVWSKRSLRILNPPHPLCSLQRLDQIRRKAIAADPRRQREKRFGRKQSPNHKTIGRTARRLHFRKKD